MKKYLITLIPVVLLGWQRGPVQEKALVKTGAETSIEDDIKPVASQYKAEELTTRILSSYHYRKTKLNDSLSAAIYDKYIDAIDHGKLYYLASDINEFDKYKDSFDDYLQKRELDVPFQIYNVFRKRFKERSDYIQTLLKKPEPFDYTVDESMNTDREKAAWAKSADELNDTWRKYLKSEALDLKLSGKADTAVVSTLRDRYKNRDRALGRIRTEQVFQMFMNAYAESMDPHTSYMAPTSADRFKQEISQSLEGIGAILREEDNYIKIVEVIPGGPAFKGKQLKKEDKIVAVAQGDEGKMVDIIGWFVDDAVKLIKGPKSTVVRLQVISADAIPGSTPKEYRLVREKIKLEEQRAKSEIVSVTNANKVYKIGVIDVPLFYRDFEGAQHKEKEFSSTTRDVQKLITELQASNVEGIVIDLRNNGGGSLTEAVSLTGLFINRGPVVQVKEGPGEVEVQSDNDPSIAYDGPLAVMVNRFSASASEIFAAAIQDYKRGIIVGEQTYGKGTVQTLIDLNQWVPKETEQLGQVKLTVAKFYRINGSSTQLKGVMPDMELPTAFKVNEYGEGSQPSALPWDQIASSRYELTNNVNPKIVDQLRDKYKQRLKTDEELKTLVKTLDDFKEARENKVVSLQESKRKLERDEAEKKRAAMKQLGEDTTDGDEEETDSKTAEAPKDKKKKDVYLTETGRILADLIVLSKEPSLAGAKKK
ncbi:carboxy terminal-processing peptidase [Dyadobacter sediminis]|uniref:Tail-specific protease n=1 Tax=Dyadobacter sediminis TaxID=1493691 RepID=A0A5R9K9F5_9BACT|nr:carboxy terminal-processing peptidase [Dyadobacter sediminis]TLU90668.1 tail-specific protease [Dyadobacter sediminis]GGC09791.1 tail-specific protease [Dyadobacter sediminis]